MVEPERDDRALLAARARRRARPRAAALPEPPHLLRARRPRGDLRRRGAGRPRRDLVRARRRRDPPRRARRPPDEGGRRGAQASTGSSRWRRSPASRSRALAFLARPASWFVSEWPEAARRGRARGDARPERTLWATDGTADWLLWRIPDLRGRIAYDVRFELYDAAGARPDRRLRARRRRLADAVSTATASSSSTTGHTSRASFARPERASSTATMRSRSSGAARVERTSTCGVHAPARIEARGRSRESRPGLALRPDKGAPARANIGRCRRHCCAAVVPPTPSQRASAVVRSVSTPEHGARRPRAGWIVMSVATASMLPPLRRAPSAAVADAGEGTTLERVTVGAANVGIAFLMRGLGRAARGRPPGADGDGVLRRGSRAGSRRCRDREATMRPGRPAEVRLARDARRRGSVHRDPPYARRRCDPRDGRRPVGLARRHGRGRRGRRRRSPTAPSSFRPGRWHCAPGRDPRSRAPSSARPCSASTRRSLFTPERLWLCALVALARRRRSRPPHLDVEPRASRRRAIDVCRPDSTVLVVTACDRLLERAPIRLRLLPRPRQRDAPWAPAPGRHVLAVRRRHVLRARRRIPRRYRSPTGACSSSSASRTRLEFALVYARPAPGVQISARRGPRAGRGARREPRRAGRRTSRIRAPGRFASACRGW